MYITHLSLWLNTLNFTICEPTSSPPRRLHLIPVFSYVSQSPLKKICGCVISTSRSLRGLDIESTVCSMAVDVRILSLLQILAMLLLFSSPCQTVSFHFLTLPFLSVLLLIRCGLGNHCEATLNLCNPEYRLSGWESQSVVQRAPRNHVNLDACLFFKNISHQEL